VLSLGGGGYAAVKVYDAGYARADAEWEAKALQSKIDAMEKDRDDARAAAASASLKAAALEERAKAADERTAQYVEELAKRPDPGCNLTADDLRGMRSPAAARPRPGAPRKGASSLAEWLARSHAVTPAQGQ
jgi:hypothetical protein